MFNKSIFKIMTDRFSIQQAYSFLFGMLGAIFVLLIVQLNSPKPKNIVTVNITQIVAQFMKDESQRNTAKDSLNEEVKRFGVRLEKTLKNYSKTHHVILMPSEAVIVGTTDATAAIKSIMQHSEQIQ
jgi:hypothetical protein